MSPRQNITCKKQSYNCKYKQCKNYNEFSQKLSYNCDHEITFKITTANNNKDAEYNPKIVWLFN